MNDQRTPTTQQQPDDLRRVRMEARRRRRRKLMIIRTLIVLAIVLLIALIVAAVTVKIVADQKSAKGEATRFLAVKNIVVEGDTRYTDEEIIKASKLYVGQSLLSVNKVQAHDALTAAFPYLETVEIGNASFYNLRIRLTEVPVLAVAECDDGWMILGDNNRALELVEAEGIPEGLVHIVGATFEEQTVGKSLLDERSLRICRTLLAAANRYGLSNMTTIDIREKTKIQILLDERMQVVLGNETNLDTQIEVLVDTLPTLYKNNGEDAAGRLDMIFYSDDNAANDRAVYTPQEVLDKLQQAQQKPMAAVQTGDTWTIINKDNLALESVLEEQLPEGVVRVTGATYETAAVGKTLLDKRSLTIVSTLLDAAAHSEQVHPALLDISDKTAITLQVQEGMRVLFGDATSLEKQVKALEDILPAMWEKNGKTATGVLDITSYADEDESNDKAVYTPYNE